MYMPAYHTLAAFCPRHIGKHPVKVRSIGNSLLHLVLYFTGKRIVRLSPKRLPAVIEDIYLKKEIVRDVPEFGDPAHI